MRLEDVVAGEQKTAQQTTQMRLREDGETRRDRRDARLRIELFVLILREIVDLHIVAQLVFARAKPLGTRKQFNQSRFPRPIDADQRNPLSALDHEIRVARKRHF